MFDPNVLFEYFYQSNKTLNFDDIANAFSNKDPEDLLKAVNHLENKNFIEENEIGWEVSDYGRNKYDTLLAKQQQEEKRSSKEYEKLQLEIDHLVNRLADYDEIKRQAKWSIRYSAISTIAAVIAILIALLK